MKTSNLKKHLIICIRIGYLINNFRFMQNYLFKNITIVNEAKIYEADVFIKKGRIERIDRDITVKERVTEMSLEGKYLLPGVIDDQVHFREPGLTHKATIYTESKAAAAGGVTSFMEMPN